MAARAWIGVVAATVMTLMAVLACGGKKDEKTAGAGSGSAGPAPDAAGPALPPYRTFRSPAEALRVIVEESKPRVLGFGEYHQTVGRAGVRSALSRFTAELFAVVAPRTSDVVLETWVLEGKCGAEREAKVNEELRATTERPAGTEDELGALVTATQQSGATPHVMTLRCTDYATLTPGGGDVVYEALLDLVTRELTRVTTSILEHRDGAPPRDLVLVYGGAMHNDRFPYESVAQWSYAAAVDAQAKDGYVEVDLYVPEYVRGNKLLAGEGWYGILDRASTPETTVLIQRGERSWIVLLPSSGAR
jgi:hypothetical protein